MDRFNSLFDNQFIYALGWTIVHSFWQCLLVLVFLSVGLLLNKNSRPVTRYWLCMAALLCCLVTSIKTFIYCYQDITQANLLLEQIQTSGALAQSQTWWVMTFKTINPWLDIIVLLWCVGLTVQALRYIADIILTQRLKYQSVNPLPDQWNNRLQTLVKTLDINRKVQFLQSTKVDIPSVIGHFKPVVLIPLGMLTQLPNEQIEAIILHELAHIKRHDYLVNLIQCLVKVVFFFNPFLLTISKQIDIERENACDDLAVKICGDPLVFAHSLSQFADVTAQSQTVMAVSNDKYLLLARVQRLFSRESKLSTATERLIALFCVGLIGLTLNVNASNQPVIEQTKLEPYVEVEQTKVIDGDQIIENSRELQKSLQPSDIRALDATEVFVSIQPSEHRSAQIPSGSFESSEVTEKEITNAEVNSEIGAEIEIEIVTEAYVAENNVENSTSYVALNYISQNASTIKNSEKTTTPSNEYFEVADTNFIQFLVANKTALSNYSQIKFAPTFIDGVEISTNETSAFDRNLTYLHKLPIQQHALEPLSPFMSEPQAGSAKTLIAQINVKKIRLTVRRQRCKSGAGFGSNGNCIYSHLLKSDIDVVLVDAKSRKLVAHITDTIDTIFDILVRPNPLYFQWTEASEEQFKQELVDNTKQKIKSKINAIQQTGGSFLTTTQAVNVSINDIPEGILSRLDDSDKHEDKDQYYQVNDTSFYRFVMSSDSALEQYKYLTFAPISVNQLEFQSYDTAWEKKTKNYLQKLVTSAVKIEKLKSGQTIETQQHVNVVGESVIAQIRLKQLRLFSHQEQFFTPNKNALIYPKDSRRKSYRHSIKVQVEVVLVSPNSNELLAHGMKLLTVNVPTLNFRELAWDEEKQQQFWEEILTVLQNDIRTSIVKIQQDKLQGTPIYLAKPSSAEVDNELKEVKDNI